MIGELGKCLKENYGVRRKFGDSCKLLAARRPGEVDFLYLVLTTKKLGVKIFQLQGIPICHPGDDCDCLCVWLKPKRKINRLVKTRRTHDTGDSRPLPYIL